jgi:hypothetical protein
VACCASSRLAPTRPSVAPRIVQACSHQAFGGATSVQATSHQAFRWRRASCGAAPRASRALRVAPRSLRDP